jgi:protein-L-isoaspartate(D-aspartate) O-methyltransferase
VASDDPRAALHDILRRRVADPRVLAALLDTPREHYVAPGYEPFAFEDRALPFAEAQTISQPTMVAIMLEALEPRPSDVALDVGTGSGYQAAILARLVERVFGLEVRRGLALRAARALAADPGVPREVRIVVGDGWRGFPGRQRFDAIVVAAAAREIPAALVEQLAPRGRLVVPVGPPGGVQELLRVRRRSDGSLAPDEWLGACAFVPLVHAGATAADRLDGWDG